jgi:hypothetical protein
MEEIHPVMGPYPTMTLFSEQPRLSLPSSSFIASILLHGTALGLISFGILCAPKVSSPAHTERYAMRRLDLHALEPQMRQSAGSAIEYPTWPTNSRPLPPDGRPAAAPPAPRQLVTGAHGAQTLLQPDIVKPLALAVKIAAPTVMIWNARNAPDKTIVAPIPDKLPSADLRASMQLPNEEQRLAELSMKPSALPAQKQPIQAGTATPMVTQAQKPSPPAPLTTAQGSTQPTSAAILSLSDLHMKDGAFTLPPVNETETAFANPSGEWAAGQAKESSQAGHGDPVSKNGDTSRKTGDPSSRSGDPAGKTGKAGAGKGASGAADAAESAASAASGQIALGLGGQPSATHITLPKNGQFEAVVVGASMAEEYPETAGFWSGRMAYTVYLHVGLAKSWILQYSLPRAADAANAGGIGRIAAPWPYNIVTPNLSPGVIDADALIVHGFINQEGRFEALAIAFPPQFSQARFVLDSLAQWQFRPAAQNGQKIKVEVVLIIPDEAE